MSTNFISKVTTIAASWLNKVAVLVEDVFASATTAAQARTAISVYSQAQVDAADATVLSTAEAYTDALGADLASTDSGKGSSLVANTVRLFNVKSYGAVGDGVTDDYTAISNAITACIAAGGGIVFFPTGLYKSSQTISITSGKVNILGTGKGINVYTTAATQGSMIVYTGTSAGSFALEYAVGSINSEGYANCTIRDITIGVSDHSTHGIHIQGSVAVDIDNCQVVASRTYYDAATTQGIGIQYDDGIICSLRNTDIRNWKYGIVSVEQFNENVVDHCNIEYILTAAAVILNRVGSANCRWSFRNGNIFACGNGILIVGASRAVTIDGLTFENIPGYAVKTTKTDPFTGGTTYGVPETLSIRDSFVYNCDNAGNGVFLITALKYSCEIHGIQADGGHGDLIHINASDFDAAAMVYEWRNHNTGYNIYSSASSLNQLGHLQFRRQAAIATEGDTTPSVFEQDLLFVNNGSNTTITNFDDGYNGQQLTVYAQQINTTIQNNSNILLLGGVDFTMPLSSSVTFIYTGDVWIEIGRKAT